MLMGLNKVTYGRELPQKKVTAFIMRFLSLATASAIIVWLVWRIINAGHIKAQCLCFVKHKAVRNMAE